MFNSSFNQICESYANMYKKLPQRRMIRASAAIPMLMEEDGDRDASVRKCPKCGGRVLKDGKCDTCNSVFKPLTMEESYGGRCTVGDLIQRLSVLDEHCPIVGANDSGVIITNIHGRDDFIPFKKYESHQFDDMEDIDESDDYEDRDFDGHNDLDSSHMYAHNDVVDRRNDLWRRAESERPNCPSCGEQLKYDSYEGDYYCKKCGEVYGADYFF